MQDFLLEHYFFIKSLHVIAIISWMAGMLYLPRLFAYHAEVEPTSEAAQLFKRMEVRLLKIIMNPAMIGAWLFGALMLYAQPSLFEQGWMHIKLTGVIAMTVLHMVFARWRKDFAADKNTREPKFYKIWNEVPAVIMIVIVIMAIDKPF